MDKPLKNDTVVIGIGNPVLSDDTIGLIIVDELEKQPSLPGNGISYCKNYSGGFDMLYDLMGFKRAILIDSIATGNHSPGHCHEFKLSEIQETSQPRLIDSHGLNLLTVLDTGRKCGYTMPDEIAIFGIEGTEFTLFSENPTAQVTEQITQAIEKIIGKLNDWNFKSESKGS